MIYSANQWIGFYMTGISFMKELNNSNRVIDNFER